MRVHGMLRRSVFLPRGPTWPGMKPPAQPLLVLNPDGATFCTARKDAGAGPERADSAGDTKLRGAGRLDASDDELEYQVKFGLS